MVNRFAPDASDKLGGNGKNKHLGLRTKRNFHCYSERLQLPKTNEATLVISGKFILLVSPDPPLPPRQDRTGNPHKSVTTVDINHNHSSNEIDGSNSVPVHDCENVIPSGPARLGLCRPRYSTSTPTSCMHTTLLSELQYQ